LSGAFQAPLLKPILNLGQAVANAPKMPAWKAGDAFGKAREQTK